MQMYL